MQAPARPPRTVDNPGAVKDAKEFERCYREAYHNVDKAITLVTENKHEQAKPLFEIGLTFLDRALETNILSLSPDEDVVKHYTQMQEKMRMTRKEVLYHFTNSQLSTGAVGSAGYPLTAGYSSGESSNRYPSLPASDLTPSVHLPPPTAPPRGNSGIQGAYLDLPSDAVGSITPTPVMSPQEGELVFRLDNGVQIFFIYPDGRVTSPSYPSFLAIITFNAPLAELSTSEAGAPRGFLQVGEWSYPLMTQTSPVLHSFYGAYMFPDPNNSVQGSHVGIIIPDSVSKDERELFESVLTQMTCYREQTALPLKEGEAQYDAEEVKTAAEKIATGVVTGAEKLSSGIVWGSEKMSDLMAHLSDKLQKSSPAAGTKGNYPTHIDPKWQSTAKAARYVSGKAVNVSSYILGQVGKATLYIGKSVAPHIQHHGTKAICSLTGQTPQSAGTQVDGVMEVAAGAVRGASTVYMGLEKAAETLAVSLTQNTVKVVTHKYGADAGQLTDNTLYAVGQSAMAGHNVASLGVKGVAKKAAKDTGKALVLNHKDNKRVAGGASGGAVVEGMEVGEDALMEVVEQGVEAKEGAVPKKKKGL